MDLAVPALLFMLGFGAALLAGRSVRLRRDRGEMHRLPLEKGAVRLDLLASGGRAAEGSASPASEATGPGEDQGVADPEMAAPGERIRRVEARARRRR